MTARRITTKSITLDVRFEGTDKIVQPRPNQFRGGVVAPELGESLEFSLCPEVVDADGLLNPPLDASPFEGAFQINIMGTTDGYRELARYLLGIAELDTTVDPGFHEHHEVRSDDGRVALHLIVRKVPG